MLNYILIRTRDNKCKSIKNKHNLSTKIIPEKVKNIFKGSKLIRISVI